MSGGDSRRRGQRSPYARAAGRPRRRSPLRRRSRPLRHGIRAFRVSRRLRHEYPRWRKQGVRRVPKWTTLEHPGSGGAVDADTLAIGDEAVASGVPPALLQLVSCDVCSAVARALARVRKAVVKGTRGTCLRDADSRRVLQGLRRADAREYRALGHDCRIRLHHPRRDCKAMTRWPNVPGRSLAVRVSSVVREG